MQVYLRAQFAGDRAPVFVMPPVNVTRRHLGSLAILLAKLGKRTTEASVARLTLTLLEPHLILAVANGHSH